MSSELVSQRIMLHKPSLTSDCDGFVILSNFDCLVLFLWIGTCLEVSVHQKIYLCRLFNPLVFIIFFISIAAFLARTVYFRFFFERRARPDKVNPEKNARIAWSDNVRGVNSGYGTKSFYHAFINCKPAKVKRELHAWPIKPNPMERFGSIQFGCRDVTFLLPSTLWIHQRFPTTARP
jgi:energy-coupling factor transporter transmembrane protein EcfT